MKENSEYTRSDWLMIKKVVNQLLELTQDKIPGQIDILCAESPKIKPKVIELIALSIDPNGKTLTPKVPASKLFIKQVQLNSGDKFGKYKIIKKLGLGGMGQVYLAQRDDEVLQQVAIKVLNPGVMNAQVLARFDTERRILASMEHPNITRLIDAGTEGNHVFYVMEFIDGVPVDSYCEQNQLDLDARLELFLQICDAVSYAHRNLVVHRDLKPGNILVNKEGEVKLLDFGIAKPLKLLPGTEVIHETMLGTSALTPQYAAPEQINGEQITVACDIYVLGLLLSRLLTNQHAFEFSGKSWGEIDQVINHQVPILPSKQLKKNGESSIPYQKVKGDLDDIVSHALNKEPIKRYSSVSSLMSDITSYLNKDPIAIKKSQKVYRLKKLLNKHWPAMTILLLIMTLLSSAVITVRQERDIAIREKQRAEIISDTFVKAFKNADPTKNNGEYVSAIEIVNQTRQLIKRSVDDEYGVNVELGLSIAEVYRNLGDNSKALNLLKEIKPEISTMPNSIKAKYFAELITLGIRNNLKQRNVLSLIEASNLRTKPTPGLLYAHAEAFRMYAMDQKAEKALLQYFNQADVSEELYFQSCSLLGLVYFAQFKVAKSEEVLTRCLYELGTNATDNWILSELYFQLGKIYATQSKYEKAITNYQKAIEQKTKSVSIGHISIGEIDIFLSDALLLDKQYDKALFHAERGLESRKLYLSNNQGVSQEYLAKPMHRIARYQYTIGNLVKADELYKNIINLRIQAGAKRAYNTAIYYQEHAMVLCGMELFDQAKSAFNEAIKIIKMPKYKPYNQEFLMLYIELDQAECLWNQNKVQQVKAMMSDLIPKVNKYFKPENQEYKQAYLLYDKLNS